MIIELKKQPRKFLASLDENTRKKINKALEKLKNLEGNIVRLKGTQRMYRLKIDHYRVIFEWEKGEIIITVIEINSRTNIKY